MRYFFVLCLITTYGLIPTAYGGASEELKRFIAAMSGRFVCGQCNRLINVNAVKSNLLQTNSDVLFMKFDRFQLDFNTNYYEISKTQINRVRQTADGKFEMDIYSVKKSWSDRMGGASFNQTAEAFLTFDDLANMDCSLGFIKGGEIHEGVYFSNRSRCNEAIWFIHCNEIMYDGSEYDRNKHNPVPDSFRPSHYPCYQENISEMFGYWRGD